MATSFAALASQFLNKPPNGNNGESSMYSSNGHQPMFFSFSTDSAGSRHHHNVEELDDLDDPHLGGSSRHGRGSRHHGSHSNHHQDDGDDPYLRLDDDEEEDNGNQSIPLMATSSRGRGRERSPPSPQGGWLAHQAYSSSRSPSPAETESTESGGPPPEFLRETPSTRNGRSPPSRAPRRNKTPSRSHSRPGQHGRGPQSLSLTQSLLPRDGHTRPLDVFSLPDPRHVPRARRKFNDSPWTAAWLAGVSICFLFCVILLFTTNSRPNNGKRGQFPYRTLLHTVPLITILTFVSALVAYTHVLLLRIFVGPVMFVTSVFVPATLFISALWAFIGSFMWDEEQVPTWGETTGLRLFSIVPLLLSLYTARRLMHLPRHIHATSSTLTLSTKLLIANPLLLALSPSILLLTLLVSIPFVTMIFRLLLVGYSYELPSSQWGWHVRGWAHWAIAGAVSVWLWTWGVSRGILRMTSASVIGAWYFADPDVIPRPPMDTHTIHAALTRSTGPSLGTVCLSALILTGIRILSLLTTFLNRLPMYISYPLVLSGVRFAVGFLDGVTTALSKHALVYAGLTGDAFMSSARRSRALTSDAAAETGFRSEPPLTLLTIAPLTLTFPFALITYLFVAHTLGSPDEALGASVLAGGVTALVGLFCVGLVRDTADTLYVCYCIDRDMGVKRKGREEVANAFEYGGAREREEFRARAAQMGRERAAPPGQGHGLPVPVTAPGQVSRPQSVPVHEPAPTLHSPLPAAAPAPLPNVTLSHDINPFEQSYLSDDEDLERQRQQVARSPTITMSATRNRPLEDSYAARSSTTAGAASRQSSLSGGTSDDEEVDQGIFPGSGLF